MNLTTTYKIIFFTSLWFLCSSLSAQAPIAIAANDYVTTTIFFPSNIEKVVPPAVNFQFTYDKGTNIGLLKGRKGKSSNLLVITEQGFIYSFALSFAEEVTEFNFILTTKQAISRNKPIAASASQGSGTTVVSPPVENNDISENTTTNTKPENDTILENQDQQVLDAKPVENLVEKVDAIPLGSTENDTLADGQDDLYDADREEYYKIFCENNYLQKAAIIRRFGQHKKIVLRLSNVLVDRNEKYFVLHIENNSRDEFNVGGVSFFRKSDVGQLEKIMTPLFTYNLQEIIDSGSINEIVLVFPNFDISNKEQIIIVLASDDFKKMVKLPLRSDITNLTSN